MIIPLDVFLSSVLLCATIIQSLYYMRDFLPLPDFTLGCHSCVESNETIEIENISLIEDLKIIIEYDLTGKKSLIDGGLDACLCNCKLYLFFGIMLLFSLLIYLSEYLLSVGEFSKRSLNLKKEFSIYICVSYVLLGCLTIFLNYHSVIITLCAVTFIHTFFNLVEYKFQ